MTRELGEFEKNEKNKIKDAPHNSITAVLNWLSVLFRSYVHFNPSQLVDAL